MIVHAGQAGQYTLRGCALANAARSAMRNHRAQSVLAIAVAFAMTACARVQWQRPGTDAAVLDRDLQQCEEQARVHAARLAAAGDKPAVIVSPRGQAGVVQSPHVAPASDPAAQYDALRSCMRARGYRETGSR
jgi:hypothetical protein